MPGSGSHSTPSRSQCPVFETTSVRHLTTAKPRSRSPLPHREETMLAPIMDGLTEVEDHGFNSLMSYFDEGEDADDTFGIQALSTDMDPQLASSPPFKQMMKSYAPPKQMMKSSAPPKKRKIKTMDTPAAGPTMGSLAPVDPAKNQAMVYSMMVSPQPAMFTTQQVQCINPQTGQQIMVNCQGQTRPVMIAMPQHAYFAPSPAITFFNQPPRAETGANNIEQPRPARKNRSTGCDTPSACSDGMSQRTSSKRSRSSKTRSTCSKSTALYVCGYCGAQKPSFSACADGRVRIRCDCGGQHADGKKRMHATWSKLEASHSVSVESHEPMSAAKKKKFTFVDVSFSESQSLDHPYQDVPEQCC